MKRLAALLVGFAAALVFAQPAHATDTHKVESECATVAEWYGNPDEAALVDGVTSTKDGLVFDGKSLVHHALTPTKLADLPKHALLDVTVVTGVAPLVKFETSNPYSTLNIDKDGKWWSSKIDASMPGGQSNPLAGPAEFVGLPLSPTSSYTADTTAVTVGLGYANDPGNKAVVKALTFAGKTYDLTCAPKPTATPTASPSATAEPTDSATGGPAAPSTSAAAGGGLPVTGPAATTIAIVGVALIAGGVVLVARRRRHRFEA